MTIFRSRNWQQVHKFYFILRQGKNTISFLLQCNNYHKFSGLKQHSFRGSRMAAAAAAKLLQSCLTLCDPVDGNPPDYSIPGILQARILEWIAISFSKSWKWKVKVKSLSRVWLSDPMDCSLPGSSVHGGFQARVLESSAIAFSSQVGSNRLIRLSA